METCAEKAEGDKAERTPSKDFGSCYQTPLECKTSGRIQVSSRRYANVNNKAVTEREGEVHTDLPHGPTQDLKENERRGKAYEHSFSEQEGSIEKESAIVGCGYRLQQAFDDNCVDEPAAGAIETTSAQRIFGKASNAKKSHQPELDTRLPICVDDSERECDEVNKSLLGARKHLVIIQNQENIDATEEPAGKEPKPLAPDEAPDEETSDVTALNIGESLSYKNGENMDAEEIEKRGDVDTVAVTPEQTKEEEARDDAQDVVEAAEIKRVDDKNLKSMEQEEDSHGRHVNDQGHVRNMAEEKSNGVVISNLEEVSNDENDLCNEFDEESADKQLLGDEKVIEKGNVDGLGQGRNKRADVEERMGLQQGLQDHDHEEVREEKLNDVESSRSNAEKVSIRANDVREDGEFGTEDSDKESKDGKASLHFARLHNNGRTKDSTPGGSSWITSIVPFTHFVFGTFAACL